MEPNTNSAPDDLLKYMAILNGSLTVIFLLFLPFTSDNPGWKVQFSVRWVLTCGAVCLPLTLFLGVKYGLNSLNWRGYFKSLLIPLSGLLTVMVLVYFARGRWRVNMDSGGNLELGLLVLASGITFMVTAMVNLAITIFKKAKG